MKKQLRLKIKGFTAVELLIGLAVVAVFGAVLYVVLSSSADKQRGISEGQRVVSAATCGGELARSTGSASSVTFATMVNNGCFGRDPNITDKGTSSASVPNTLLRLPYVVQACNLTGTGDGIEVQTRTSTEECVHVARTAAEQGAVRVGITPSGGTEVVVKSVASPRLDVASLGLAGACAGAQPISVNVCVRY